MDAEDWSWMSLLAGFSEAESPDSLLDTLLQDDVYGRDAVFTPVNTPRLRHSDATPVNTLPNSSSTSQQVPSKRKRAMRPKEEIECLKASVVDLENLVNLLRQRQDAGRATSSSAPKTITETGAGDISVWAAVASRQYKYLRSSEGENAKLRSQVHTQMHIIQGLVRLVQRAQRGLPNDMIPLPLVQIDRNAFMAKQLELLDRAMHMHSEMDAIFHAEPFISTRGELMNTASFRHAGDIIPPGTTLATSWLRRRVSCAVEVMSDSLWGSDVHFGVPSETFQVEYIEKSPDRQILQLQLCFPSSVGPVRFLGAGVQLRNRNSARHEIVTASSVWPSATNPSPWSCVGMDMNQWSAVSPLYERSPQPHAEVVVKTQASKLARSPSDLNREEASVLLNWISSSMSFTLERLQRDIDNVLLGRHVI